MEVGYQSIYKTVFITGVNEDLGKVTACFHHAICTCGFQSAYCSSTYGNDASTFSFRLVNGSSSFFAYSVELSVHLVVFDFFRTYGTESAKANVQGNENFFAAFILNFLQHFFSEMQACSRSSSTTTFTTVNCLVTLLIFQRCSNIRRQRSFSQSI